MIEPIHDLSSLLFIFPLKKVFSKVEDSFDGSLIIDSRDESAERILPIKKPLFIAAFVHQVWHY